MIGRAASARRLCTALAALLVALAGCGPPAVRLPAPVAHAQQVRVGLAVRVARVELRARGLWRVRAATNAMAIAPGALLLGSVRDGVVSLVADGVEIATDARLIQLVPAEPAARLVVGEAPYAGQFELRQDAGLVTCIETLDIEAYLRGVVPFEIGRLAPEAQAAVEAQAIAARTYTLARIGWYAEQGFDVYADERDQVYKGELRHDDLADRAVHATRGQVLLYHGQLAQAYYSSTCGGFTAWIDKVWPKPAAAYLCGRRDAPPGGTSFCRDSRHFRWTEAWSGADLDRIVQETLPRALRLAAGTRIGTVTDVRVAERDASARVLDLQVQTTSGTYTVHGDTIRWVLRPRERPLLRSLMFDLQLERDGGAIVRVVVRGAGNGHGVGMCQSGAIGMARAGYDVRAILQHYYPGITVQRLD
jgi:stage II sporulation protein D